MIAEAAKTVDVAELEEEEWPEAVPDLEEEWPDTLPDWRRRSGLTRWWTWRGGSLLTRWRTSTRSRMTRCRWPSKDDAILSPLDDTMVSLSKCVLIVTSRNVKL